MKVIVSCLGKFHAFALAEQLNRHKSLAGLFTAYAYQKNVAFRRLAKRIDKEDIPAELIHTNIPLAFLMKGVPRDFLWNDWYDRWVASQLKKRNDYKVFIGWSGMSLHAIRQAKKNGKLTILERGSSHILYQDRMLHEEYNKFGIDFHINKKVIEKELQEYEEADFVSVPSQFVKNSFLEYGIDEKKLFHNPYGTSAYFKSQNENTISLSRKFRILYLGGLTIQKGLIYLFEAIHQLNLPKDSFEVWFIGSIAGEMKSTIDKYNQHNWRFFGHINHYDLQQYLSVCDIAVQPSLQEGLSMVIPQCLSSGVPVIATTNTGGQDIIEEGVNGFIIPIRSPAHMKEKIEYLFHNPDILNKMKDATQTHKDLSWDAYGDRYVDFLKKII
jgi:glycosyltransferase involved in cell wall biosynthesis